MSIPLATVEMWGTQLAATTSLVGEVNQAAIATPRTPANGALGRQWVAWLLGFQAFVRQQAAGVPPILPLPPPLPSVLVRPDAWRTLMGWDTAARQWADRWRRAGASMGPLPPLPDPPPTVDPSALGLGIGTGLSIGTIAAVGGLAFLLFSGRR